MKMKFKIFFVLAYITLVMGFNTDARIKRQILKDLIPSSLTGLSNSAVSSFGSGLGKGLASATGNVIQKGLGSIVSLGAEGVSLGVDTVANAASNVVSKGLDGVRAVGGRVQTALNNTYQQEKDSVSSSWDSVKNSIIQSIETGANLTKTAFDLGTIGPKLGKNLILG